ncbi:MAG: CsbD family protein [Acidimicrobiia bacterium]
MTKDSGPENAAKGIVEDIKGKAKEVIGEVTGDDAKEREGRAQQDKAQSQREVAEHEAKADAARSEAAAHEAEQRVHQDG